MGCCRYPHRIHAADVLPLTCRRAYAPLVEAGYVEVVYGGAREGAFLCNHKLVRSVHLTGSAATYDAVVWGKAKKARPMHTNLPPSLCAPSDPSAKAWAHISLCRALACSTLCSRLCLRAHRAAEMRVIIVQLRRPFCQHGTGAVMQSCAWARCSSSNASTREQKNS